MAVINEIVTVNGIMILKGNLNVVENEILVEM